MTYCSECGTKLTPGAKFCHNCGNPLRRPFYTQWILPALVGAITVVAILIIVRSTQTETGGRTPPSAQMPPPQRIPPDLSQMTPRQAADQLFNRVMRAAEVGDSPEALRFVPMALGAYQLLGGLDADARYHVGALVLVTGNWHAALAHADTLAQVYPNHLFAEMLRARAYQGMGRMDLALDAYHAYLEHEKEELDAQRPEYSEHDSLLQQFASEALQVIQAK